MTYDEKILRWLDTDVAEIKETSAKDKCRKIEITYPLYEEYLTSELNWYDQGNKLYIPSISGINNCLYVINTSHTIDYLEKNYIQLEAEEVLTEMNYDYVGFVNTDDVTTDVKLNKGEIQNVVELDTSDSYIVGSKVYYYKEYIGLSSEVLRELFGDYYDIESVELSNERKQITPSGTMTYMSLFRLIEEQTERSFFTTYINYENTIIRRLNLLDTSKVRHVAQTEYLDLNYNLESLELTVSEEDTYNAMAPEFSSSTTMTASNANTISTTDQLVSKAENTTTPTTNTTTTTSTNTETDTNNTQTNDLASIIDNWLNYEVEYRQEVPMIIKEDADKNLVTSATWYAPFMKRKGCLFIESTNHEDCKYSTIQEYNTGMTKNKIGKVSTSETIPEMIYNTLANSLLNKLRPEFELKISVKDVQVLLGISNLGYQLFETLYVRIPNFDYYVPCQIVETTKNLHHSAENTIKVESKVGSRLNMKDTKITANDVIFNPGTTGNSITGLLTTMEDEPVPNEMVTLNIRLKESYPESVTQDNLVLQQQVIIFNHSQMNIVLSRQECHRLHLMYWYSFHVEKNAGHDYIIQALDGKLYNVAFWQALAIINTYYRTWGLQENDIDSTDTKIDHKPEFSSISIGYIKNAEEYLGGEHYTWDQYYPNNTPYIFSLMIDNIRTLADTVKSIEQYTGEREMYTRMGVNLFRGKAWNMPSYLVFIMVNMGIMMTYTEATTIFKQNSIDYKNNLPIDTLTEKLVPILKSKGLNVSRMKITKSNIKNYVNPNNVLFLYNPYVEPQEFMIHDWTEKNGVLYLIGDSKRVHKYDDFVNNILKASELDVSDNYWLYVSRDSSTVEKPTYITPTVTHLEYKTVSIQDLSVFLSDSIQNAVTSGYELYSNNTNKKLDTISVKVVTSDKKEQSITMKQLRALAYVCMLHYHTEHEQTKKLSIQFGSNSTATRYYERFGGDYDFFTPCVPRWSNYRPQYIISTVLFNLGVIRSYYDFLQGKTDTEITFNDLISTLKSNLPNGDVFTVPATEANIRKYTQNKERYEWMNVVCVAYCKASVLDLNCNYPETVHPVLIYGVNGDTVRYQNISGKGNSPNDQYDTTISEKGTSNPYQTTRMETILGWIQNATEQAPTGDGGQLLVAIQNTKVVNT